MCRDGRDQECEIAERFAPVRCDTEARRLENPAAPRTLRQDGSSCGVVGSRPMPFVAVPLGIGLAPGT